MNDDWCSEHGGWGSRTKPCKVCGAISPPNDLAEIPDGLSYDESVSFLAMEMELSISRKLKAGR